MIKKSGEPALFQGDSSYTDIAWVRGWPAGTGGSQGVI